MRGRVGVSAARDGVTLPAIGELVTASAAGVGTSVTPGVSNTTGLWTELLATSGAGGHWLTISVAGASSSGASTPMLMDIGIGATASEVLVVPSIAMGQWGLASTMNAIWLPVFIPAGVRLACRITSSSATPSTPTVRAIIRARASRSTRRSPSKLVALGADVANSTGVAITSNNTWVEITAATTQPFQALVQSFTGADTAFTSGSAELLSMGVGANGAEVTIDAIAFQAGASESVVFQSSILPVNRHIPAGTRVVQKVATGATNQGAGVVLGVPYT